jgi:DNA-binding NarL/FixJ family response regulator
MKRILVVDDHEVVREGVKSIFGEQPGNTEFGEASTAGDALRMVNEREWDIVILDLSLGGKSGLEVLKDLKLIRPRLPVLILSMHSEEQYARRAFKSGAAGYVTKDTPREELFQAISRVMQGGRYVSPDLAERLVSCLGREADRPPHEMLSDREFEVLRLIASGNTITEIAGMLNLSDKTISTYRARVLDKLGRKNNAELIRYAIENRLI